MRTYAINNQKGVALVFALIMSVAIMAMVTAVLYFVTESTSMSGAGRGYATADEAADGAVNVVKDAINLTLWGDIPANVFTGACSEGYTLEAAITTQSSPCTTGIQLPGMGGNFTAVITLERLYSMSLPGGRMEFARAAGGAPSTAIYFRISARVTGPNNTSAENSALYRFAG